MCGEGEAAVFLDIRQEESIGINQSRCIIDAGDVDGLRSDGCCTIAIGNGEVDDDSAVEVSFWCVVVGI